MKLKSFLIITIFLSAQGYLWACEPCGERLDLEKTIRAADLIVVGQKMNEADADNSDPALMGNPDSVMIHIKEVLKGAVAQDMISVNSWDGMCAYGIVVGEKEYVVFLAGKETASQFDAVNHGCSVKTLPVKDVSVKMVEVEGKEMPLKQWEEYLNDIIKTP